MTTANTTDRLLPIAQVRERYGVHTTTIDRWVQAGKFPLPIRLADGRFPRRFWRLADLEAFERQRVAAQSPMDAA